MKYRSSYKKYSVSRRYGKRRVLRVVVRYYGGKDKLTPVLIKNMKQLVERFDCNVYGELCAGGARTLLNLPHGLFDKKIYNEFSLGLCKLFSCVKNQQLCSSLIEILHKLPYNKALFEYARINRDKPELDILSSAALTYANIMQSRNADAHNFKLGDNEISNKSVIRQYYKQIDRIKRCTEVLADTTIINGNMFTMLEQLNNYRNVLAYIDPSYHPLTRADGALDIYPYEMTQVEHIKMVEMLL